MENSNDYITSENLDQILRDDVTKQFKSALKEAADKGAELALEEISNSPIQSSHVVATN